MRFTIRRPRGRALRLALWGNFGSLNLGNECTLAAIIFNLRRRSPSDQLVCICTQAPDAGQRHALRAVPMWGASEGARGPARKLLAWISAAREMRQQDALMVVGTGILTDHGEGRFGLPYELFKWALLAKLFRRPVLFLSVGVESITQRLPRFFFRTALRLADYRSYRDQHSHTLVLALDSSFAADPVFPDLAFSLPLPAMATDRLASQTASIVAVGLYNHRNRGAAGGQAARDYTAYLDWIASLVVWLMHQGHAIRIIIGDYAYDEAVRLDLRAELNRRGADLAGNGFEDEPAKSFEQVMEQIRAVDLVVASRFHNVLLSLLLGRPVLSISYDPKNDELMRTMGLGDYCQRLDAVDFERLTRQFLELQQNAPALRAGILARATKCRRLLEQQYDQIMEAAAALDQGHQPDTLSK